MDMRTNGDEKRQITHGKGGIRGDDEAENDGEVT